MIIDQWVLTAAHCVVDDVVRVTVELGQHRRNTDSIELIIPLAQVLIHPDYRNPQMRRSSNDLALLKLDDPVDFNNEPNVRPICLPSNTDERFAELRATVAGWGITTAGGRASDIPLETEVIVISDSRCKETYGSRITEDMLCTISPRDGPFFQGFCKGDSGYKTINYPSVSNISPLIGGPLMISDNRLKGSIFCVEPKIISTPNYL